jgi:hypothetical protein
VCKAAQIPGFTLHSTRNSTTRNVTASAIFNTITVYNVVGPGRREGVPICPKHLGEPAGTGDRRGNPGEDHFRSWVTCQRFPDLERQGTGSPRPSTAPSATGVSARCAERAGVLGGKAILLHCCPYYVQDDPDKTRTAFSMWRANHDFVGVTRVVCGA